MNRKTIVNPNLPGRYGRMTVEQFDREVAKFDREFIADTARPMTPQERARDQRARGKGSAKSVAKPAKRVLVQIDPGLLKESDRYAKKHGLSRSALIAKGLEAVLKKTG